MVKIVASCIPGFEKLVLSECDEQLGVEAEIDTRGRVIFEIGIEQLYQLERLRSIHHFWVLVKEIDDFFSEDGAETPLQSKEESLKLFYERTRLLDWRDGMEVWRRFRENASKEGRTTVKNFKCKDKDSDKNNKGDHLNGNNEEDQSVMKNQLDFATVEPLEARDGLSFRATCYRTGKHEFSSMEVAKDVGGSLNDTYGWRVDLTNFDVEIVVYVHQQRVRFCVQLTLACQSERNISYLGPTTLKPNIAYCLLRLAQIKQGDVVLDPMCGCGSIGLEGEMAYPYSFQVLGENHPDAVNRAEMNFQELERNITSSLRYTVCQWDIHHLPLRTESVDAIVTDLPFGKKMGTRKSNMLMYPRALEECARVCRPGARLVMLTQHMRAMKKALSESPLLIVVCMYKINMGGLNVFVYVMKRVGKSLLAPSCDVLSLTAQVKYLNVDSSEYGHVKLEDGVHNLSNPD